MKKKKGDEKRIIKVQLELNSDEEVVPKWQDNADISSKMNAVTKLFVNGELKKIGYTQQSPKNYVSLFKNGQKGGNPGVTTVNVSERTKKELLNNNDVEITIEEVKKGKTPKESCDEQIDKYKKQNGGKAPEWNPQKNGKRWKDIK